MWVSFLRGEKNRRERERGYSGRDGGAFWGCVGWRCFWIEEIIFLKKKKESCYEAEVTEHGFEGRTRDNIRRREVKFMNFG